MATLPLTPLALVSTQRTVPSNGSPSSQDYNDDQNDGLIDLTSLVSFINGTLIPLLQVLPSLAAAAGLEGRAINTDSTNLTALCFNALTSTPLTIAQSLNYLQNLQTNLQSQITGLSTQVAVLSSQLSSTNQNDISLALQNFQSVLNTTTATLNALQTSVNNTAATTPRLSRLRSLPPARECGCRLGHGFHRQQLHGCSLCGRRHGLPADRFLVLQRWRSWSDCQGHQHRPGCRPYGHDSCDCHSCLTVSRYAQPLTS